MNSFNRLMAVAVMAAAALPTTALSADPVPSLSRQDATAIDGITKKFMDNLIANDPKSVVAVFIDASPLMAGKTAEISNLEGQVGTAFKIYGKVSSVELASEKVLGTTAVRRYYLARHQNLVTRWELNFAHTGSGWTMTYFGFDDQQRTWFGN